MKFHIRTYGCQMNERDSEAVTALLCRHGFECAGNEAEADIVLVNTCSVRAKAEEKALGKLGLLAASRKEYPGRIVGAIGCMVERLRGGIFDLAPGLDFAVGPNRLNHLPRILEAALDGRRIIETGEDGVGKQLTGRVAGGVCAFVVILYGCSRRCSYCIVPAVRGGERSRPALEIISEVRTAADQGVREVTLLGQSVMSYGARNTVWPDAGGSPRGYGEPLPRLLEAVGAVDGIERVRFTSGHPSGCTAELADAMRDVPEVCEHLHLPAQSGSDRILKLMRRGYTAGEYRHAAAALRKAMPDLALTTDIIVGFPGETIEDFELTRAFMEEMRFDNAFIFKYSPRPGTVAAEWADDVSAAEKARRNAVLLADQDERGLKINGAMVGRAVETLVEGPSTRNRAKWSGRTRGDKIVIFGNAGGYKAGDLVSVEIERAMPQTLCGRIIGHGGAGTEES